MATWVRLSLSKTPLLCTRTVIPRYYTDSAYQAATQKWQLAGVPRPKSILEDDDAVVDLSEESHIVDGARANTPPIHLRRPSGKPTPHEYKAHRETLRKSFPDGWSPPKKLSRQAMDALRQLHHAEPKMFHAGVLAEKFKISPEAVRRILKSKWEPSAEKRTSMAIKERKERELFIKDRMDREQVETENVRQLRKISRSSRKSSQDGEDPDNEGARGISSADTFTFQ